MKITEGMLLRYVIYVFQKKKNIPKTSLFYRRSMFNTYSITKNMAQGARFWNSNVSSIGSMLLLCDMKRFLQGGYTIITYVSFGRFRKPKEKK